MILKVTELFQELKKNMLSVEDKNYLLILKLFLNIENLEWAAYILKDLFNLQINISRDLLDVFLKLN